VFFCTLSPPSSLTARCFQFWGVVDQLIEIHGVCDNMKDYKRYHPSAPDLHVTAQSSSGQNIAKKLGLIG